MHFAVLSLERGQWVKQHRELRAQFLLDWAVQWVQGWEQEGGGGLEVTWSLASHMLQPHIAVGDSKGAPIAIHSKTTSFYHDKLMRGLRQQNTAWSPGATEVNKETSVFFTLHP